MEGKEDYSLVVQMVGGDGEVVEETEIDSLVGVVSTGNSVSFTAAGILSGPDFAMAKWIFDEHIDQHIKESSEGHTRTSGAPDQMELDDIIDDVDPEDRED